MPAHPAAVDLAGLLDLYLGERVKDNKPGTRTDHRTTASDLDGHFGSARLTGADAGGRAALMSGLGMNNGTGLVLASTTLAALPRAVLPVIAYDLAQHLAAGLVDRWWPGGRPGRCVASRGDGQRPRSPVGAGFVALVGGRAWLGVPSLPGAQTLPAICGNV